MGKHILFLPRWYPDENDPQNAVFIQKHAKAVALKHKVSLIYVYPVPDLNRNFEISSSHESLLEEIRIRYRPSSIPLIGKLINLILYTIGHLQGWRKISRRSKPDIIHIHMLTRPGIIGIFYKLLYKSPVILTEHWTGFTSGKFHEFSCLKQRIAIWTGNQAQLITVVSPSIQSAMKSLGFKSPIKIIPNVVESQHHPDATFKFGQSNFHFLNVSDFYDDKKNITGLLSAFHELVKIEPKASLHIIGDGPDREIIERSIKNLPLLKEKLTLYGRLPNPKVLAAMQQTDAYICFSNVETFSVATAEALAAGKPVICTRCGGPEYFVNSDVGIVIEKGNETELIEAATQIIQQKTSFEPEHLKKYAEQLFSIEAVSEQFDIVYSELLNE